MLDPLVKKYLYNFNSREIHQKKTGQFIFDYPESAYHLDNKDISFIKKFFLKNNYVFLSKHNRFADYPRHGHDFLEFNYMLSGQCRQIVNFQEVLLTKGDMLLLDCNSVHEIKALSENDILINIIFPSEKLDSEWLTEIVRQNNVIFSFLIQDITKRSKGSYIFFKSAKNKNIQSIIEQMLNDYFTDSIFSNEKLRFFVPILFMELIGNTNYTISEQPINNGQNEVVVKSLKVLKENFKTITLQELGKQLHYNKTYLSNLIKNKTGHTFTELVNDEKLKSACLLLQSTSLSIREISENIGFSNLNYFYKIFKGKYGLKPGEWREREHTIK